MNFPYLHGRIAPQKGVGSGPHPCSSLPGSAVKPPGSCSPGKEREQRETREPMFAHIIAADVGHRRREVGLRMLRMTEFAPAPCAAQIEPVEVRDLAVAAVADDRGREQRRRMAFPD